MREFLAVELPAEVRAGLEALRRRLDASCRGWRWLDPKGIHLTLRFLGEVDRETDSRCRDRWRSVIARGRKATCVARGVGVFPTRGVPRVLWVGVEERTASGALAALARDLESEARAAGFSPERRPFRPHLTVGRARRGARAAPPDGFDGVTVGEFPVEAVILFRSRLGPGGATYEPLDRFPIGPEPGEGGAC